MNSTTNTIGVLIDRLEDYYQNTVLWAVEDAAAKKGFNVICFTGGVLHSPERSAVQRNVIYDLAHSTNVDGLIIASGTLANEIGVAKLSRFCKRYAPLPMCSIATNLEGIPTVLVDNNTGMRQAVRHLIDVHDKKHIAFIRGPAVNDEAEQRYNVYKEVLEEHKFKFDPSLIADGNFEQESGKKAIAVLLDDRKVHIDALVSASDDMAIGAMEALASRGIKVPEQVAVVSFDDDEEARLCLPPLTTVRQPLKEQVVRATQMLIDQIRGQKVADCEVLHTKLVVRKSCGCAGQTARLQEQDEKHKNAMIELLMATERSQARRRSQAERWSRMLSDIGEALITSFDTESQMNAIAQQFPKLGINSCFWVIYDGDSAPSKYSKLAMVYDRDQGAKADGRKFETKELIPKELMPNRIYTYVVQPLFFEQEQMGYALFEAGPREGNIYEALRDQISAAMKGASLMKQVMEEATARRNLVRYILDVTPDMHHLRPLEDLAMSILKQLTHIIGTVEDNSADELDHVSGFLTIAEEDSETVLKIGIGRFKNSKNIDQDIDKETLLHINETIKKGEIDACEGQIIIPLKVGELILGVVYLEGSSISPHEIDLIRILSNQATVAIQNVRLYEMATLDPLTGVHARRFFDRWLIRELRLSFRTGLPLSLLMLDVDKLKTINDTAGHLRGDQALAIMGHVLRQATRNNDIVGRYGGDEFVVILPDTDATGTRRVGDRILKLLQKEVLKTQHGLLPVRSSVGMAIIEPHSFTTEDMRLKIPSSYFGDTANDLIQCADDALYEAKRKGRNQIHHGTTISWKPIKNT